MINGKLLRAVLMLDGNETNYYLDSKSYDYFTKLIVELTKAHLDIRYCTNEMCSCHPEHSIKRLIEKDGVRDMLVAERLYESIREHVENYEVKILKELEEM